jgi:hypothetical protein
MMTAISLCSGNPPKTRKMENQIEKLVSFTNEQETH